MEKYIALDLGTKTIGIAFSDSLGIVHSYENYTFSEFYYKLARSHVLEVAKELEINNIVLGYPLELTRNEGKRCESVKRFASDLLSECPSLNIYLEDESFTTIEARERLKEEGLKEDKIKKIIDMMSAVVILEDFLRRKEKIKWN